MDKYVGKRLDGRYEINEIIGVGGMAVVYKAFDIVENRVVAIKILKDEFIGNSDSIRRFKNESKAIAMLSHPNIVRVYDVSFGDLIQYIVMEYIDGITLKEYIESRGSLLWNDAVYFAIQILRGLQHAHDKGIIHRDVKPQNIMVLPDKTIKVADFGIARFARGDQRTATDMAIGSVHYISPEQARGEKTDEKADIYSVGVMLYEMLTGKLPFDADSAVSVAIMQLQRDPQPPTQINPSIPKGLEQITMQAMQKSSERRYQSAAEMLCDLEMMKKDPTATFQHSYFVDKSPTKYVDALSSTPAAMVTDEEEDEAADEKDDKNRMMIPILSGVAAALVVAIAILAVYFVPKFFKKSSSDFKIPDYVGKTRAEIESDKNIQDYFSEYFENVEYIEDYNSDFEKGKIFKQSPLSGRSGKKTKTVLKLYVSKGPKSVEIPDELIGMDEDKAIALLEDLNLIVHSEYEVNKSVANNCVFKYDLSEDKTEITIFVNSDKQEKQVSLENIDVEGFDITKAEEILKENNLIPDVKKRSLNVNEEYHQPGYVLSQSPKYDSEKLTSVTADSKISLVVLDGSILFNYEATGIPNDYIAKNTTVSIWKGNEKLAESKTLDFSSKNTCAFENVSVSGLSIQNKSFKADIKMKNGNSYDTIYSVTITLISKSGSTYRITAANESDRVDNTDYPKFAQTENPEQGENT